MRSWSSKDHSILSCLSPISVIIHCKLGKNWHSNSGYCRPRSGVFRDVLYGEKSRIIARGNLFSRVTKSWRNHLSRFSIFEISEQHSFGKSYYLPKISVLAKYCGDNTVHKKEWIFSLSLRLYIIKNIKTAWRILTVSGLNWLFFCSCKTLFKLVIETII